MSAIDTTELAISGTTSTTTRANLRQGAPSTKAPILRKLEAGTALSVRAVVVGEAVAGNAHWFATDGNGYVWAGACSALRTTGATAPTSLPVVAQPAAAVSSTVRVVDLYHGDAVTSFADACKGGLVAVIHKATTGGTGRDDAYRDRRQAALANGLLWGAYHWGTAAPIAQQLDNFLGWAEPDDRTVVALDYEPTPGNQMTLAMAKDFLDGIATRLGRRAVLYSGNTIKADLGHTKDGFFGSHRLWLAQYGSSAELQASWDRYWLWQYTDGELGPNPKFVSGIPGNSKGRLDCDHFAGTEAELRAQWV